jgi:hypothetical protein
MKRVQLNAIIDAVALVVFMCLASTGLILRYQLPPGSGSELGRGMGRGSLRQPVELLWGQSRHEWGDYHYWIAIGLLAVLAVHLFLHWKWIVCVVRGQKSDSSGLRLALGLFAFVMLTLAVALPLYVSTDTVTRGELQQQRVEQNEPGSNSR